MGAETRIFCAMVRRLLDPSSSRRRRTRVEEEVLPNAQPGDVHGRGRGESDGRVRFGCGGRLRLQSFRFIGCAEQNFSPRLAPSLRHRLRAVLRFLLVFVCGVALGLAQESARSLARRAARAEKAGQLAEAIPLYNQAAARKPADRRSAKSRMLTARALAQSAPPAPAPGAFGRPAPSPASSSRPPSCGRWFCCLLDSRSGRDRTRSRCGARRVRCWSGRCGDGV
jgi:hypothetical protein